jgi:hypothetical protein
MATIDNAIYYNSFISIDYSNDNNDNIYKKINNKFITIVKKYSIPLKIVNLF